MRAYKGFSPDLSARMGRGKFKYEIGKTYKEDDAQCARTGFHCVEEPIRVLDWYGNPSDRYCIVEVDGDIHEDGNDKISAREITIVREISRLQLLILEAEWLSNHPNREFSKRVFKEKAEAGKNEDVIVRGKHPKAAGMKGSTIILCREQPGNKSICEIAAYTIDGKEFLPGVFYNVNGRKVKA